MKKQMVIFAAVCAAACCLAGCNPTSSDFDNEYDALNEMLNASYSQVVVTVTDTFDENTSLTSEYTIAYSDSGITVHYAVEKFAELSLDAPSAEVKTTLTGTIAIQDGMVVSIDGDDISLTADIAKLGLTFREQYFKNVNLSGMYLEADVKDASAFLGTPITCSDMKVQATFLEVFFDIKISYTSESGSSVKYVYNFTL